MTRIILVYGILAGAITIASIILGILLHAPHAEWLGYLIMLVALSLIFMGVKRYRDGPRGGVVRFGEAFGVGLGIAAVASVMYVLGWELYLWATNYSFITSYAQSVIAAKKAAGASPRELATVAAEMGAMVKQYANPLNRMGMTIMEILPVSVAVALLSAGVLRFSKVLPAR